MSRSAAVAHLQSLSPTLSIWAQAGIGVDVPWHLPQGGREARISDPDILHAAMQAALDAGANGQLLSREYDEMSLASVKAIGRFLAP